MRTCRFIPLMILIIISSSFAQTTPQDSTRSIWKKDLRIRVQLSQLFFKNWTKGGENTFNWILNVDNNFTRNGEKVRWDNIYRVRYGESKVGDNETTITENEIDLRSDIVFVRTKKINPFVGATLKTQAATGFKFENDVKQVLSSFSDPLFLTQKFGVDLALVKDLKLRISLDFGQRISNDFSKQNGIDNPNTQKLEKIKLIRTVGVYSRLIRKLRDNIAVDTVLEVENDLANFSRSTVNWRNVLDFKLIKSLSLSIDTKFRYDEAQSKKGQFKQATGFSIVYNFFN